jgi:uncharacterized phage-associated protein
MSILSFLFGTAPSSSTTRAPAPVDTTTDVVRAIILRLPGADRLSVLKLTYLVQVVHLGRHGTRLIPTWFKATALGVYDEDLSRTCRYRISRARYDREHLPAPSLSPAATAIVDEVCEAFGEARPGSLVAVTTMPGGAWHSLWQPDAHTTMSISDPRRFRAHRTPCDQGPVIDMSHMLQDYRLLTTQNERSEAA